MKKDLAKLIGYSAVMFTSGVIGGIGIGILITQRGGRR